MCPDTCEVNHCELRIHHGGGTGGPDAKIANSPGKCFIDIVTLFGYFVRISSIERTAAQYVCTHGDSMSCLILCSPKKVMHAIKIRPSDFKGLTASTEDVLALQ